MANVLVGVTGSVAAIRVPELVDHPRKVVTLAGLASRRHELRDFRKRVEISADLLGNAGPLHFHRHHPAVSQRGPVHLSQRGCGNRTLFEHGEGFRQPHAELLFDDLLDLFEGHGLHVVLQPRQRIEVAHWQ